MAEEVILVVEGGPNDGNAVPLGHTTTMGRDPHNDVVVPEPGASRKHAEIVEKDGEYHLRDLSSTNGSFVNGVKTVGDHLLKDGDTVRLGTSDISLTFHSPGAETLQLTLTPAVDVAPTQAVGTAPSEDLYEGTVRLRVSAGESMRLVVDFASQLRERPELRLLRMVRGRHGDTEIWLALRQPVSLQQVLGAVQGVVQVSPTWGRDLSLEGKDRPLTVTLSAIDVSAEPEWTPCVHCRELLEPGTKVCPRCRRSQA